MKRASRAAGVSRFLLLGLGVVIALLGLALAVGGAKLVSLGGSWYFLLGGVVMAISGLLIARCKPAGAWLFAAFLVATAVWAVADVGLEYWPLFSRLFMFAVIGVVVALVYPLLAGKPARVSSSSKRVSGCAPMASTTESASLCPELPSAS